MAKSTKSRLYIAADGTYGNASNLLVIEDGNLTDEEWEKIEEASDHARVAVALKVIRKSKNQIKVVYNNGVDKL